MSVRPQFVVVLLLVLIIAYLLSGCATPRAEETREDRFEQVRKSCREFQFDPFIFDGCVIERCNKAGCWN